MKNRKILFQLHFHKTIRKTTQTYNALKLFNCRDERESTPGRYDEIVATMAAYGRKFRGLMHGQWIVFKHKMAQFWLPCGPVASAGAPKGYEDIHGLPSHPPHIVFAQ